MKKKIVTENEIKNAVKESISEHMLEATPHEKQRNIKDAINTFKKRQDGWNGIRTFGILSAENPDSVQASKRSNYNNMKRLAKTLKNGNYVFVKQDGHLENIELSYFIFNISLDVLSKLAGKYEQTSFFYCQIVNEDGKNKVDSSYYQKTDVTKPVDAKTNPYQVIESTTEYVDASGFDDYYPEIGKRFKYSIPLKCFEDVNRKINENLMLFENLTPEQVLDWVINRVGQHSLYMRSKLYKGLL